MWCLSIDLRLRLARLECLCSVKTQAKEIKYIDTAYMICQGHSSSCRTCMASSTAACKHDHKPEQSPSRSRLRKMQAMFQSLSSDELLFVGCEGQNGQMACVLAEGREGSACALLFLTTYSKSMASWSSCSIHLRAGELTCFVPFCAGTCFAYKAPTLTIQHCCAAYVCVLFICSRTISVPEILHPLYHRPFDAMLLIASTTITSCAACLGQMHKELPSKIASLM